MIRCPTCNYITLKPSELENNLPVLVCKSCKGTWIRANEYALWLKTQQPGSYDQSQANEAGTHFPITESNKALACPDCGHYLRKYQIGSKLDFHLDRCNNCHGVWLENNEWETLKMADLHDEINRIFTKPWQDQIEKDVKSSYFDTLYLETFGDREYKKIKEIRTWLEDHPNRNSLIAFLLDNDPYSG